MKKRHGSSPVKRQPPKNHHPPPGRKRTSEDVRFFYEEIPCPRPACPQKLWAHYSLRGGGLCVHRRKLPPQLLHLLNRQRGRLCYLLQRKQTDAKKVARGFNRLVPCSSRSRFFVDENGRMVVKYGRIGYFLLTCMSTAARPLHRQSLFLRRNKCLMIERCNI